MPSLPRRPAGLLLVAALQCSPRADVPYGACESSAMCAESTPQCTQFFNRITGRQIPLCTRRCTTNADCPDHGVCAGTETASLGSLCVQGCTVNDDCRFAGAICPVVRDGQNGCVP